MYEAYYLGLLLQGKRAEIPDGHVIRVCGEKYMHLRVRVGGEAVEPGNCVVQPVPGLPLLLAARCGTAGLLSVPQPSSPSSAPTTLHHCAPPAAGPGQRDVPRKDQGRGRQRDGLPRDHPRGARHEEGQHAALHGQQGRLLFYRACAARDWLRCPLLRCPAPLNHPPNTIPRAPRSRARARAWGTLAQTPWRQWPLAFTILAALTPEAAGTRWGPGAAGAAAGGRDAITFRGTIFIFAGRRARAARLSGCRAASAAAQQQS